MATKTLAVSEDAYRLLARLKERGESFSNVIVRYFKRGSYRELAGAWRRAPPEEIAALRRELAAMLQRSDEKPSDTLKRLGW